ncbi:N-terminal methylation site-containing protein, prepilin-type [Gottschalkia acidurici 9a]|uniref:N-terminal methylation site-containing protein, prepilin-type n=1 Tax=Gottschalkia acidurici (strain ATCC 7906 / DSM 604 / BCRC 14475 / CIP 104303 / KCTC 5404 / NCIMB 10678 / 9a) TaxID=1128398 RepID=K0B164_GOTA9|nr:prepilin-type N-terminal cleavage/methylation domain-containing protein [Gottschalkia acidurici]AFS78376.1 N-terminal methylation site-containing protein, prepilin-type [Gottschalkia acidurici 9a]
MFKKCSNNKGLTLVEVIVSIFLLGIVMISIGTLVNYNIKMNSKAKNQIIATTVAEDIIEEVKFSNKISVGEKTILYHNFVIDLKVEILNIEKDKNQGNKYVRNYDLYRIEVEVKLNDEVIEKLITYKTSQSGSGVSEMSR